MRPGDLASTRPISVSGKAAAAGVIPAAGSVARRGGEAGDNQGGRTGRKGIVRGVAWGSLCYPRCLPRFGRDGPQPCPSARCSVPAGLCPLAIRVFLAGVSDDVSGVDAAASGRADAVAELSASQGCSPSLKTIRFKDLEKDGACITGIKPAAGTSHAARPRGKSRDS